MARIDPEAKAHLQADEAAGRTEMPGAAPAPGARPVRAGKTGRILYPAAALITALLLLMMAAV